WLPLLSWNADNHDAGLKFQVVERHPWAFEWSGLWFLVIQPMLVTPILCIAMWKVALAGTRSGGGARAQWRYFGLIGAVSTLSIFGLGFFTDVERISFHWPLPGYLALLIAVPVVLNGWPRWLRRTGWWLAGAGLALAFGYYLTVSIPSVREQLAGYKYYPRNFAGWEPLAGAVRDELKSMPPGTRVLAGNFKVGAELGFQLRDPSIEVLRHPLNDKHGRSAQLGLWGLLHDGQRDAPMLLVLSPSDQRYRDLLARYHAVCEQVGPLPPPRVVSNDHGYQRFLLFKLPAERVAGPCVTPAMAWLDTPQPDAKVGGTLDVRGWAFKDGVGIERVELLIDGAPVGDAVYGRPYDITGAWKISTDPQHPNVAFDATLKTHHLTPGRHWLGMTLYGKDGSVEQWQEQAFTVPAR
ncbi:MAG: glycosyltransferase family 39 protein, partial [Stenotrophomonas maltophilia]